MNDGGEGDDAGEKVRVFEERDGELDERGDVLGGANGFGGVDVVGLADGDGLVGCAGSYVARDAGVEFGFLAVEEDGCAGWY